MAAIEQTAYPRFTNEILTAEDLQKLFDPTDDELKFVKVRSRKPSGNLTLLILLKAHQYLGQSTSLSNVPNQIQKYLSEQLELPDTVQPLAEIETNKTSFHRYRKAIREFLTVQSWSEQAEQLIMVAMKKAAFTMSDPADLINIALRTLADNKYELPAFRRLDDAAKHIRHLVHEQIYEHTAKSLTPENKQALDELLIVKGEDYKSDFTKIKAYPGRNTLKRVSINIASKR